MCLSGHAVTEDIDQNASVHHETFQAENHAVEARLDSGNADRNLQPTAESGFDELKSSRTSAHPAVAQRGDAQHEHDGRVNQKAATSDSAHSGRSSSSQTENLKHRDRTEARHHHHAHSAEGSAGELALTREFSCVLTCLTASDTPSLSDSELSVKSHHSLPRERGLPTAQTSFHKAESRARAKVGAHDNDDTHVPKQRGDDFPE